MPVLRIHAAEKNNRSFLIMTRRSFEPAATMYCSRRPGTSWRRVITDSCSWNKKNSILNGTGARDRRGDVLLSLHRRIRSNRNRQISSGTCIHPGGWGNPESLRAALRRRRCAGLWNRSCHWISLQCLMMAGWFLAYVHQSYGYRTIITHMRINHLKDRTLTQPD